MTFVTEVAVHDAKHHLLAWNPLIHVLNMGIPTSRVKLVRDALSILHEIWTVVYARKRVPRHPLFLEWTGILLFSCYSESAHRRVAHVRKH